MRSKKWLAAKAMLGANNPIFEADSKPIAKKPITAAKRSKLIGKPPDTRNYRARWYDECQACLLVCGGDHRKASVMADRKNPGLRKQMVREVNAEREKAARPKADMSQQQFKKRVDALIARGMEREEAVRLLSVELGLSSGEAGGFWQSVKDKYR